MIAVNPNPSNAEPETFSPPQKEYLQGFVAGIAAAGALPFVGHTPAGRITATPGAGPASRANLAAPAPEDSVFGAPLAGLSREERWKHDGHPLDIWEKLVAHAERDQVPDAADAFRFKWHGLFHVAPAQDSFMLRCRIPAGELTAHQLHGLAEMAQDWGGGYAHITTRANLQLREFKPRDIVRVLMKLQELGLTSRGAGADNIRNITASPNSGFDPDELCDVRPLAKGLHYYILNQRDLYGLPRKFNVAFDNGGSLSVAAGTNDLAFAACRIAEPPPDPAVAPGVYFRAQLGGLTGHGDFARDAGLLLKPSECVAAAAAMIRVFAEHGDRANRQRARLKYLLAAWGVEKFLDAAQRKLAFPLARFPLAGCVPRRPVLKHGHIGVYKQAQRGLNSLGVGVPAGRLSAKQMHALADLATHYGRGEIRLTVWQSAILPHLPDAFVETAKRAVTRLGLHHEASTAAGGIVACTGRRGCKYAATDTKAHAAELIRALGRRPMLENPVNIHLTGCPHSCAQHYCGDIGLLGVKLAAGEEGYHLVLGGGMDGEEGLAREIFRGLRATEVPALVERILAAYETRKRLGETFAAWVRRHSLGEIQEMFSE